MRCTEMERLCLIFLFYHRLTSSWDLSLNNDKNINSFDENLMGKFLADFKKVYLKKSILQQITIVGASTDYLEKIQPLFDSYKTCIICRNVNECDYREEFSHESLVIVFLEDLSENTFRKNIKVLLNCKNCEVLFISAGRIIRLDNIRSIFTLAMQHNLPFSKLAHFHENVIKLYSDFVAKNCSMEVRLVTIWKPGISLDKLRTWAFRSREMNGCPVSVSSLNFTPKMMIKENTNGSLTIIGGREGKLLLALASKLNFTIKLRYPSAEDQMKYSRKVAILYDVASGISEIGIGRLRPTHNLTNTMAISFPYDEECVTWGVPRVMKWSNNIVWVEFSGQVWASVGLLFAMGCIIRYVHKDTVTTKNSKKKTLGVMTIVLDAFALHLGNSVTYVSTHAGGRFLLITYLYYGTVITTAYKTSLASILATDEGTPTIINAQGIIDANLEVGGSLYDYNILKDQVNGSKLTSKLLNRFIVNNNVSDSWNRLLYKHNYAFLARRSLMNYDRQMIVKSHESVTFNVLNGCVLSYPTVILFQSRSFLRKPVDDIIQRLGEAGILWYWDSDKFDAEKALKRRTTEKYFKKRAVYKFWNIFILYFICISVSLFSFFIELSIPRFNLEKLQQAINLQVNYNTT